MEIDDVIKALANPVRRDILAWLKNPEREFPDQDYPYDFGVCAGRIFARTGLSQSTVSAHLACLQRAGLVTTRRVGQWIFYQRDEAAIADFLARIHDAL